MKNYFENNRIRKIIQTAITAVQIATMILSVTFMYLFVGTGAGNNSVNYSAAAIVSTVLWCAYYVAQAVFAITTYAKNANRTKFDTAFLIVSLAMLPLGCGIYGIAILTL